MKATVSKEFRQICDTHQTPDAIRAALQAT